MENSTGLILFAHGSRTPSWANPVYELQKKFQKHHPKLVIQVAFLDFIYPQLPEVIADFSARSITNIKIFPIFLSLGDHIKNDLPNLIEMTKKQYPSPKINITILPTLGENDSILEFIASQHLFDEK